MEERINIILKAIQLHMSIVRMQYECIDKLKLELQEEVEKLQDEKL